MQMLNQAPNYSDEELDAYKELVDLSWRSLMGRKVTGRSLQELVGRKMESSLIQALGIRVSASVDNPDVHVYTKRKVMDCVIKGVYICVFQATWTDCLYGTSSSGVVVYMIEDINGDTKETGLLYALSTHTIGG